MPSPILHLNTHECIYCGASVRGGAEICPRCGAGLPMRHDLSLEERDKKLSFIFWPSVAGVTGTFGACLALAASQLDESCDAVAFTTLFSVFMSGLCVFGVVLFHVIARVIRH